MVDVKPTNVKLQVRARGILRYICGDRAPASDEELDQELDACRRNVKLAAVKIYLGASIDEAESRLQAAGGILANIIKTVHTREKAANGMVDDADAEFVLCVDGGGSKCSAVLLSKSGVMFRGESGPCNP
jgi:N-acetylmuramic acid 6-phosphate etherase